MVFFYEHSEDDDSNNGNVDHSSVCYLDVDDTQSTESFNVTFERPNDMNEHDFWIEGVEPSGFNHLIIRNVIENNLDLPVSALNESLFDEFGHVVFNKGLPFINLFVLDDLLEQNTSCCFEVFIEFIFSIVFMCEIEHRFVKILDFSYFSHLAVV